MRTVTLFICLVILGIVCIDAAGRLLLKSETSFKLARSETSDGTVLFVHLPGILTGGTSAGIVSTWLEYGDVLLVGYKSKRFKSDQISDDVAREVMKYSASYKTIVFIGSSMGGLVAYDSYLKIDSSKLDCRFIVVDAPTGRSDLQSPLDMISVGSFLWWAGPISNPLSTLYFRLTFVKPKEENIEPDVDRAKLDVYVKRQMSHPLSWAMDQNRYITSHDQLESSSLAGRRVVVVRSTRDTDTVRAEAFNAWNDASGGQAIRMEVDSTHAGYVERPMAWHMGFERAITLVLMNR